MAAKGFPIKMRARLHGPAHSHRRGESDPISRIEHAQARLEKVADEVLTEVAALEKVKKSYLKKPQFSWMTGQLSVLTLQDFVGAAFGAMFFVMTQEVWDVAKRLNVFGMLALVVIAFLLGFSLVYLSRRRKFIDEQLHMHAITRAVELYGVSFVTALAFILILGTAPASGQLLPQAIMITLPAVVSAATADLLFF
jgi:uncharacterized membrane protein